MYGEQFYSTVYYTQGTTAFQWAYIKQPPRNGIINKNLYKKASLLVYIVYKNGLVTIATSPFNGFMDSLSRKYFRYN